MKNSVTLVIKARDGDISAFEILVDQYRDMAIGYAYSILKDFQHAEDAAQEAFVRAYFKLDTLQSPEAFPAWLRSIVFSECEHFYRKKKLPVIPMEDVRDLHDRRHSPNDIVERRELRDQLDTAVKSLPEKERTITVLCYISGYSMAEIGRFLDLPMGTVKNRLYSARKKLQKELIELMGETFKGKKENKKFTERVKNMIVSGHKQTLFVKDDGTVMNWGNLNRFGDHKNAGNNAEQAGVKGLKNVKSIAAAAGCYGSYALLGDGSVRAWGWNVFRHLGTGSNEEYILTPERVNGIDGVVSISAGVSHALALKKDGSVWAWGKNWYGQLGNNRGDLANRKLEDNDLPAIVPCLKSIKQISAGYFRSLALADDGTVWRWGGYGDSRVMFPITYATNAPVQIKTSGKIIAISAGGMHDVMLCEDGTVWACGYNTQRQLGNNRVFNEILDEPVRVGNLSDVKAISAGGSFSLALKNDGTVWAWGCNESGELGSGAYDAKTGMMPGDNKSEPVEVSMLRDVVEIAAGGSHAMAVTGDGGVWAWGGNDEGQLGDFTDSKRCVPQRIM